MNQGKFVFSQVIEFLYQTTTQHLRSLSKAMLFLIRFLHLTTIRLYAEGLCTYALASVRAFCWEYKLQKQKTNGCDI